MKYKNLEIWRLANEISLEIHSLTIHDLPAFELYETGSQVRRSSKSVKSNIVEGYGRRHSKKEFLLFLHYAMGSNYETLDHIETLMMTGSVTNIEKAATIRGKAVELGKKLRNFIKSVEKNHRT